MINAYQDDGAALKYLDFLNSKNGQIQQRVLAHALMARLPHSRDISILDAGCGSGWLAGELKEKFNEVRGCDGSEFFIHFARANYPRVDFKTADMETSLPYAKNFFDFVIVNMVGPDLSHLAPAFGNLRDLMKPDGKLLMTLPNPQYSYPAVEWKRGLLGFLLRQKPKLKIKNSLVPSGPVLRQFEGAEITSYHYNLSDYLTSAQKAGLKHSETIEIRSQTDSTEFDLNYQLYRYPLLLLLELEKL